MIEKLKNKTLRLLSYRPRSIAEIRQKLGRLTDDSQLVDQVVDYFIELDLLNDQRFADWWVEQRTSHRPKGNIALQRELQLKSINKDIIDSVLLSSTQEANLAKKLLRSKKISSRSKAYQYLYSRGFSAQTLQNLSQLTEIS